MQYNRKLKWSSVLYQNLGWFLTAFTWIFGTYVIMAYGVLIYNYLGPGEEKRYITTWGMAFLLNTFGLESLQIVGRKSFFILVITKFNKSFMKTQESLAGGFLRTRHSPDVESACPPPHVSMSRDRDRDASACVRRHQAFAL
jgi:hypothetical protein